MEALSKLLTGILRVRRVGDDADLPFAALDELQRPMLGGLPSPPPAQLPALTMVTGYSRWLSAVLIPSRS